MVDAKTVMITISDRWIELQKAKMEKSEYTSQNYIHLIESVMMQIRFPMMTPRDLADLLMSSLIKEHKEFFVDRMAIGMKYHSGIAFFSRLLNLSSVRH